MWLDTISVSTFFIVCPLVFLAGFVDSIAGGGGLISLPAYLMAGIPAHNAVATNKMSSTIGTFVSTARYIKNGYADFKLGIPGIIAALIGANIGSRFALRIDDEVFKIILMVALPILAVYIFFKKDIQPEKTNSIPFKHQVIIVVLISFFIGMYDGFYGPGTGTFLILAYTGLAKMDTLKAGGNTKLANLASNISAFVVFLLNGKVFIGLGLVAAIFGIAGNYLGTGYAMKHGAKGIRNIIIVVICLLFVKIIFKL